MERARHLGCRQMMPLAMGIAVAWVNDILETLYQLPSQKPIYPHRIVSFLCMRYVGRPSSHFDHVFFSFSLSSSIFCFHSIGSTHFYLSHLWTQSKKGYTKKSTRYRKKLTPHSPPPTVFNSPCTILFLDFLCPFLLDKSPLVILSVVRKEVWTACSFLLISVVPVRLLHILL